LVYLSQGWSSLVKVSSYPSLHYMIQLYVDAAYFWS